MIVGGFPRELLCVSSDVLLSYAGKASGLSQSESSRCALGCWGVLVLLLVLVLGAWVPCRCDVDSESEHVSREMRAKDRTGDRRVNTVTEKKE